MQQAFLRGLDAAGRTALPVAGGRRRDTRRQLDFAARIRELFDQGHTLAAALRIIALEDELAAERALIARLHSRLGGQDPAELDLELARGYRVAPREPAVRGGG